MPEKQGRAPTRESVLSIIAADLTVVGELSTEGVVKVDGVVEGDVKATTQVLISKGGEVRGDVHSREVVVGGRVIGCIYAGERVEVQTTAVVHGDIATKCMLVQEGGEVNGNLRMGELSTEASTARSVSDESAAANPVGSVTPMRR